MTCLINCICGDEDIKRVETGHTAIDALEKGFEFGTWTFVSYFTFFVWCTGNKVEPNTTFNTEEKNKIKEKLIEIIDRFNSDTPVPTEEIKKLLPLSDWRKTDDGLNHYADYTKELLMLKYPNPLLLSEVSHYQKLFNIFECETVKIIAK